jgi:hypothetical protein
MVENDLAADRKALNEAVRLDLKAYFKGLNWPSSSDNGSSSGVVGGLGC